MLSPIFGRKDEHHYNKYFIEFREANCHDFKDSDSCEVLTSTSMVSTTTTKKWKGEEK
jgi:hypothetical protein